MSLPRDWVAYVNKPQTKAEEQAVRQSANRGTPLGDEEWQKQTIRDLGWNPLFGCRPGREKMQSSKLAASPVPFRLAGRCETVN